jgi:hypothetical protein
VLVNLKVVALPVWPGVTVTPGAHHPDEVGDRLNHRITSILLITLKLDPLVKIDIARLVIVACSSSTIAWFALMRQRQ